MKKELYASAVAFSSVLRSSLAKFGLGYKPIPLKFLISFRLVPVRGTGESVGRGQETKQK
jgi:hypothetical protein